MAKSKRRKKMTWPSTRQGWITRWKKTLSAVREKATELWADRETYNEYRNIVLENPRLDKTAEFFDLVDRMYLSHVLIAVRTFDDADSRSHSLYNLMKEIERNTHLFSRQWFIGRYSSRSRGESEFIDNWGRGAHINRRRVSADLRQLTTLCRRVRKTTNKRLAHNARRKPRKSLTYGELNKAIDGIYSLVSRYNVLLFCEAWGKPAGCPSWHIFETPWIERASMK